MNRRRNNKKQGIRVCFYNRKWRDAKDLKIPEVLNQLLDSGKISVTQ